MPGSRKACPVVVRHEAGRSEILAFRHPYAGCQLVKGTMEAGETVERSAERELLEESGMIGTAGNYLGTVQMSEPEQEWHFVICDVGKAPESWTHRTSDGGGLDFEFFWYPLNQEPNESWHPHFRQALAFISQHLDRGAGAGAAAAS
jgi:ADP-ribose pyrophosphatase YjhB (NUDIX family)